MIKMDPGFRRDDEQNLERSGSVGALRFRDVAAQAATLTAPRIRANTSSTLPTPYTHTSLPCVR